ncbi:MAG: hypothetical protein DWI06_02255 [Planctomycetota bacterium]|nr:MAG: hypothetical protein DWI06_02255 [Planctomycetota bacterium]
MTGFGKVESRVSSAKTGDRLGLRLESVFPIDDHEINLYQRTWRSTAIAVGHRCVPDRHGDAGFTSGSGGFQPSVC